MFTFEKVEKFSKCKSFMRFSDVIHTHTRNILENSKNDMRQDEIQNETAFTIVLCTNPPGCETTGLVNDTPNSVSMVNPSNYYALSSEASFALDNVIQEPMANLLDVSAELNGKELQ